LLNINIFILPSLWQLALLETMSLTTATADAMMADGAMAEAMAAAMAAEWDVVVRDKNKHHGG
jgi:hypothetical protein